MSETVCYALLALLLLGGVSQLMSDTKHKPTCGVWIVSGIIILLAIVMLLMAIEARP